MFGDTSCRDGWGSPSIGSRGACSHHGGVTSNIWLFFLISGFITFWFYQTVESKYRTYGKYVVSVKLPKHSLKEVLEKRKEFKIFQLPYLSAKSKQPFQCVVCGTVFKSGTTYKFYKKGSKRIRHCMICAAKLPELIAEVEAEKQEYYQKRSELTAIVEDYYRVNSKAVL